MIATEKPPLEAIYIAHYGVRGMKWGYRKDRGPLVSQQTRRRAKRAGKIALISGGAILALRLLTQMGAYPANPARIGSRGRATISTGRKAAVAIESRAEWKRKVHTVLRDIANANAEQDRWMRSQGLGASVNNPER